MKKKPLIRVLSSLLLLLVLVGSFAACAEQKTDPKDTLDPDDTTPPEETRLTADLPPMTFDGYTFSILHWDLSGATPKYNDLHAEDDDGDPIISEVYRRNARLSEQLDIEFEFDYQAYNEIVNTARSCVSTSTDSYDLVLLRLHEAGSPMMEGTFLDFENDFQYIDLDKPWWDQGLRRELSFGNHLFLASADITNQDKDDTYLMAFNKKIVRDAGLDNPYELVENGEWTLEKFYSMAAAVAHDDNGDGVLSLEDDTIGFLDTDDATIAFFFSLGGRFTEKDSLDLPEYVFNDEDNFQIVTDILDLSYDENVTTYGSNTDNGNAFIANRGLFDCVWTTKVIGWRGEETLDFGVVPCPNWNEGDDYYALVSRHHCGLLSVLRCEENADTVGYILEAMAAASHYDLRAAYYDITLKTKSARDDESQGMLDLIFSHRTTDIAEVCDFGGFSTEILRLVSRGKQANQLASTYASSESKIDAAIEKFIDQVDKIDEMRG